jgi:rhamnulokinase
MAGRDGRLCWDLEGIFKEIIIGMKKCAAIGKIPRGIGVDTWGVDYALLDGAGNQLGNAVAYRDGRTAGMDERVHSIVTEEEMYRRTGIKGQIFNTVYQLMAVKETAPELLEKAAHMLLIPDYLHYRLCGVISNEYTNATTTGLVNGFTKRWDGEIIASLGFPGRLFGELTPPGTVLGSLTPEIRDLVGYDCAVVAGATHDTASAVTVANDDAIYISSGTWSLMGIKANAPNVSPLSRAAGFTNEGGYDNTIVFCKNIMGLWMIQSLLRELGDAYDYTKLDGLAEKAKIVSVVDCNHSRFFAPGSMSIEVKAACVESRQQVPRSPGELSKVIYQSLAACYAKTATQLEELTGRRYDTVHVIGGGANAEFLNRLTAQYTGKKVVAGPSEATAIGNLKIQAAAFK